MANLTDTRHSVTDMVNAAAHDEEQASAPDWALLCHSIFLSAHSKAFAASDRHGGTMKAEVTKAGKRVMRLPLTEQAARSMLRILYGCPHDARAMGLSEACQLAVLSNMKGIQGGEHPNISAI